MPPQSMWRGCLRQEEMWFMSTVEPKEYPKASSRGRLLLVEDRRSHRELIANILVSEGYDVLTAKDGLDALGRLVEPLPIAIISDLNMPRMSGFEFLALVRQRFPHLPVLAMSGDFDGNELPTGVLADAYLPKGGYTLDKLRTTIDELLSVPPRRPPSGTAGVARV
jgi:CheY-like chemotaxis protein